MKQCSLLLRKEFPWFTCREHRSTFPPTNKLFWTTANSQREMTAFSSPEADWNMLRFYHISVCLSYWSSIRLLFHLLYLFTFNAKYMMNVYYFIYPTTHYQQQGLILYDWIIMNFSDDLLLARVIKIRCIEILKLFIYCDILVNKYFRLTIPYYLPPRRTVIALGIKEGW